MTGLDTEIFRGGEMQRAGGSRPLHRKNDHLGKGRRIRKLPTQADGFSGRPVFQLRPVADSDNYRVPMLEKTHRQHLSNVPDPRIPTFMVRTILGVCSKLPVGT